jgi:hypothetical protein
MCACVYSLVHLYIEARTYRRVRTQSCIDVMVSECVRHALAHEVRLSGVCTLRCTWDKITYDSGDSRGFYIRFTSRIALIDLNKLLLNCKENYPTNNGISPR